MLLSVLHAGVLLSQGDNDTFFIPQAHLNSLMVQTHAGDTDLYLRPIEYFLVQTQHQEHFEVPHTRKL